MATVNYITQVEDGTKTAPGYSFRQDTDTGVYRIGVNNLGISVGDTKVVDVATTGVAVVGTLSASGTSTFHDVNALDSGNTERIALAPTTTGGVMNIRDTAGDSVVTFDGRNGATYGINTTKAVQLQSTLSVTGIATFAAGAVGAPSIAATGDLNTGFWFPAADTIAASVNGVEGLRLTTAGLGIGVALPTALLHVGASTTARASLCVPHGTAPTSPVNGDIWTDTSALYVRINGATKTVAFTA